MLVRAIRRPQLTVIAYSKDINATNHHFILASSAARNHLSGLDVARRPTVALTLNGHRRTDIFLEAAG